MPRQPRLDLPGQFYHVIARGVSRCRIFRDNHDRTHFLGRLVKALSWSGGRCFAWSLMPNHFHLLIQAGFESLGKTLHRALTGYAVTFNLRHHRSGHLFQNRFKSILCQTDGYFQQLVRYIHLNPLRAKLVKTFEELARYAWTGHAVLIGQQKAPWQEVNETLSWWGSGRAAAVEAYLQFMKAGMEELEPIHLEQGYGLRSLLDSSQQSTMSDSLDVRVLGNADFAWRVLSQVDEREREALRRRQSQSLEELADQLCLKLRLPIKEALSRSKRADISRFRALAAFGAVDRFGWPAVKVARFLGVSEASLSAARRRGQVLWPVVFTDEIGNGGN